MRAVVDAESCIGCGMCAQAAPDIYQMQGDKAVTVVDEVPEGKEDDARNGADQCPVDAIEIK